MEEAKKLKVDIGEIELDFGGASVSSLLDSIKDLFLNLMTSEKFDKIVFECLKNCTYNGIKITKQLFDDIPEARADYYQIIKECVEINLAPFLKSLTSQLSTLLPTVTSDSQESGTPEAKMN